MKKIKRFLSLIVVLLALVFSTLPVYADDGSITITPGDSGTGTVKTQYNYYQLLNASISDNNVSYYLDSPSGDALKELLDAVKVNNADLFTFTKSGDGTRWNVSINKKADNTDYNDSDGPAIAEALNTAAIKANAIATDRFSYVAAKKNAVASNLNYGYYLVTSSLGSALVLQTLGSVTINTKNEYITDTKTASKTNMSVGDTVTYTITIHVPATAIVDDYVTVHDTLDERLSIKADTIVAKLNNNSVTLEEGTKKAETETFAKKFKITSDMLGNDVVITYDAELLSNAADDTGYVNTSFAETSAYETLPSKVKVYTFDFDIKKTFSNVTVTDDNKDKYTATFELKKEGSTTPLVFISDTAGYVLKDSDDASGSSVISVNGKDTVNIRGLAAGNYVLTEKTTAPGYNALENSVLITITDTTTGTQPEITPSHTVSYKIGSESPVQGTVSLINNSGSTLPSTGGIGTTIFHVAGAALAIGAAVLLISKKRMNNN